MAGQAYTPGLLVTPYTSLTRVRELPLSGMTLVKPGDRVEADTPVLAAELPGEVEIIRIADQLGLDAETIGPGLRIGVGQRVEKGDLLCEIKTFFGMFSNRLHSPVSGHVEFFTETNAHLGIRYDSHPITVDAYVSGVVLEVEDGKSVTVSTEGAFVQGIFGVGGERRGTILSLDCPLDAVINDRMLQGLNLHHRVLVGGAAFSGEALRACAAGGVSAVITGSIDSATLGEFAGEEISVSVTGDEDVPFTLIITEGFGRLPLSHRVATLLQQLSGKACSVNGATQVRAGATRPEIIVPLETRLEGQTSETSAALAVGRRIRLIRMPHFGQFATIREMPGKPERVPSGAIVRVLRAEIDNGEVVTVPRSNVELV